MKTIRLDGTFELLSPLQHTGESISTDSYLNEAPILLPNGRIEEVFVYNGNAWRGQLRDCAARYMLNKLGIEGIQLPAFHLLFSGGSIGGKQSVDIEQARVFRKYLPIVSLLGGGVGNQLLAGKLCVCDSLPCCKETIHLTPHRFLPEHLLEYRHLTCEKSFSRKDDSKDEQLRDSYLAIEGAEQLAIEGTKKAKDDGPATQMRYTIELMIAGARLYTRIDCKDVTDIELGCLVSALDEFARAPYIGGGSNRGHGLVRLTYLWQEHGREPEHFLSVGEDESLLSEGAQEAKDAYDDFLRVSYLEHLEKHTSEIRGVLESVK